MVETPPESIFERMVEFNDIRSLEFVSQFLLETKKDSFLAMKLISDSMCRTGKFHKCVLFLEKSLNITLSFVDTTAPESVYLRKCLYNISRSFYNLGRYNDALLTIKRTEKLFSSLDDYELMLKGLIYRKMNLFKEAIKFLAQAITKNPYLFEAIETLISLGYHITNIADKLFPGLEASTLIVKSVKAKFYNQNNKFDEALTLYSEHNEENSKNCSLEYKGQLYRDRSIAYSLQNCGRLEEAYMFYKKSMEEYPYNFYKMDYYSSLLWQLKSKKSLLMLSQTLFQIDKESAECWLVEGNCFSLRGDTQNCCNMLERAISINKNYEYAYVLLGFEQFSTYKEEESIKNFRKAISINPFNFRAWFGLGAIHLNRGVYKTALDNLKKSLSLNNQNTTLYTYIGKCFEGLKEDKMALKFYQKGVEIDSNNTIALFSMVKLLKTNNNLKDSLYYSKKLLKLEPNEGDVYIIIGEIYKEMGDNIKALENLYAALEKIQNNDNLVTKIRKLINSF